MAIFHKNNPMEYEGGNRTFTAAELRDRTEGQKEQPCCQTVEQVPCTPGTITNLVITSSNPTGPPPPPYDTYNFYVDISWDPLPNALSYIITTDDTTVTPPTIVYTPGTTSAVVYYNGYDNSSALVTTVITVTAVTPCGETSASTDAYPCFLAGAIVQMAGGETKLIEDVKVGDQVLGAFGEINTVLALHRPLVGTALMCKINDEHSTTNHHPHISADRQFYCGNPELVQNATYGKMHTILDKEGRETQCMLLGLKKTRIKQLTIGIVLKTVDGQKEVNRLETYSLPSDTQLYNLVVSGSHTYHVDGYAVTGWPREDDFDYDSWTSK